MGYPNDSTTQILPTTGSLALTEISSLSGNYESGGIGPLTVPYRLSELGGQDTDIPISPNPIRFSQFRGAINYNYNYRLLLTGLSEGSNYNNTYPLFYRSGLNNYQNPYSVVNLSNISRFLTLKTKGSSVDVSDTFVRRDGKLNCSISGYLDHDVTLWMQINNELRISKIQNNTAVGTVELLANPKQNLLDQLLTGLNDIAPELVTTLTGTSQLDPFKVTSSTLANILQGDSIIAALNRAAADAATGTNALYKFAGTKSLTNTNNAVVVTKVTYEDKLAPLCYSVGSMRHHERKQGWSSASFSVDLSKYPIDSNSEINFYIGEGPGAPRQGHIWGSTSLAIDIINTPTTTYPDP